MAGKDLMTMKDIDAQLALHVTDAAARIEKPAGQSIGIKGKKFSYKSDVLVRTAEFVIVDFIRANAWYDEAWSEDDVALPGCLALSVDGEEMAPLPLSPNKQNDTCDGCELNAWGSAETGRGKACAEQYKLAILAVNPQDKNETYSTCEMATITVPPTSKKNFGAFVRAVEDKTGRPPLSFLTEFAFDDDFDHPVLTFEVSKAYKDAATLSAILGRVKEAREMLMAAPDFSGAAEQKAAASKKTGKKKKKVVKKKAKKKVAKKKATKKKASKKTGRSKYA
jgi:hypothetical protein